MSDNNDTHSPKYSPKSSPYTMTGLGEDLNWKPTSSDPKFTSAAEEADAAQRRQEKLDAEKGRTAFAIAHSVGIDGSLNPVLAQPTLPSLDGADSDAVPVMRKNPEEPLVKRAMQEVKEVGRVVKDVVGKVVHGAGKMSEGGQSDDEAKRSDSHQTEVDGYDGSSERDPATDHPDDTTDDGSGSRRESVTQIVEAGETTTPTRSALSTSTPTGEVPDSNHAVSSEATDHRDLASLN